MTDKTFNPHEHMMTMTRRQRQPDGSYKTVHVDYLQVMWRIVWFREEHPNGSIQTRLLSEPGQSPAVVQATVTTEFGNVTTGFGQQGTDDWSDWLEKAETRAIGRALGLLGYGTQFAEDFEDTSLAAQTAMDAAKASNTSQPSKPAPQKRSGQPQASYTPLETTGDAATDAINIMERIEAAKTLTTFKSVIVNAKVLGVIEDSDVSGAIVLKLTDALEKITAKDALKSINAVAEDAGVAKLGAFTDARADAIGRIDKEAG